MQRCPKCNRTYQDDAQKFCTFDGGRLVSDRSTAPTSYDLDRTATDFDPNLTMREDREDLTRTMPSIPQSEQPQPPADFDPYKTIAVSPPPQSQTGEIGRRDTGPTYPQQQPPAQPQQSSGGFQQPPPQASQTGGFTRHIEHPQANTGGFAPQPPPSQSQPLPTQQPTPQHVSAPLQQPQQYAPQAQPVHAAQAPQKRSRMPLIIGGAVALIFLLLVGAAAAYFVLNRQGFFSKNANTRTEANTNASVENANTTANANAAANTNANAVTQESPSFAPPPNSTKFTNSVDRLSDANLTLHFVPFTFYYPDSWQIDPNSGKQGSTNFVEVRRELSPNLVQESITAGWYESGGTVDADSQRFPTLVETYSNKFAKSLDNYHKISEGPTRVNSLDAYEFRFEGHSMTERGDVKYWGRMIFLPPGSQGSTNGVRLTMFTTSLAPELNGVDDVGVKGQLPVILNSFRFGE